VPFTQIAEQLPGRNSAGCRRRYQELHARWSKQLKNNAKGSQSLEDQDVHSTASEAYTDMNEYIDPNLEHIDKLELKNIDINEYLNWNEYINMNERPVGDAGVWCSADTKSREQTLPRLSSVSDDMTLSSEEDLGS